MSAIPMKMTSLRGDFSCYFRRGPSRNLDLGSPAPSRPANLRCLLVAVEHSNHGTMCVGTYPCDIQDVSSCFVCFFFFVVFFFFCFFPGQHRTEASKTQV